MTFSVMIVDSKAATRSRIASFLRKMPDAQIVAQAACPREAAEKFHPARPPDLVVMGPGLQMMAQKAVITTARRVAWVKLCLMRGDPDGGPRSWDGGIGVELAADAVLGLPDEGCEMGGMGKNGHDLAQRLRRLLASQRGGAKRRKQTDVY